MNKCLCIQRLKGHRHLGPWGDGTTHCGLVAPYGAIYLGQHWRIWANVNLSMCSWLSHESNFSGHDDVIKWKHFPRNWPFVREIHRSPVNCPHKGQWRGALMFSLIYAWINDWVNNREAGDLRRQHGHYDVIVMKCSWYRPIRWVSKSNL